MSANRYYSSRLSGRRLQRCYQIAPFRIRQYLESELQYVLQHIQPNHSVLELGCGYGRILPKISQKCQSVIGIDISYDSIMLATEICKSRKNVQLTLMDAGQLSLKERSIDVVICIQNGISAFKLDPKLLLEESIRITKRNGICLFSSYSEKFWKPCLKWFVLQSREGLIGEIDWTKTGEGRIVYKDGFSASTFTSEDFWRLTDSLDIDGIIQEVDDSSLFLKFHSS